jgi:hypothetical protein
MISNTVIGPATVPQSYCCPFWTPKTMQNNPEPESRMPIRSKECECFGCQVGTSATVSAIAMTSMGTLTKKIHSQPKCWTRTPPSSGPVIVASPAMPPHIPIAGPRLAGGKRWVMNASVCGVISAAPRPCTARAAISISTVPDSPHHSDAPVKTIKPAR